MLLAATRGLKIQRIVMIRLADDESAPLAGGAWRSSPINLGLTITPPPPPPPLFCFATLWSDDEVYTKVKAISEVR